MTEEERKKFHEELSELGDKAFQEERALAN